MKTVTELATEELRSSVTLDSFDAFPIYKEFEKLFMRIANKRQEDGSRHIDALLMGRELIFVLCKRMGRRRGDVLELFKRVLSLKPAFLEIVNPNYGKPEFPNAEQYICNRSAIPICEAEGQLLLLELLRLALMGDSLNKSVITRREKVERLRTMARLFLANKNVMLKREKKTEEKGEGKSIVEGMLETVMDAFDRKVPFSEDVLFIVWQWNFSESNGRPLGTPLWKHILKNVKEVLKVPINSLHWRWFETHVLHSAVWCFSLYV